MRIQPSPRGRGSAEAWVREHYVEEVARYRSRQAKRAKTALIVMIDADTKTVKQRLDQLDQALKASGGSALGTSEEIARLVPKRNVETWILCLTDEAVDEETDYKTSRDDWSALIRQAARALYDWSHSDLPDHCTDSLNRGVRELNRLTF